MSHRRDTGLEEQILADDVVTTDELRQFDSINFPGIFEVIRDVGFAREAGNSGIDVSIAGLGTKSLPGFADDPGGAVADWLESQGITRLTSSSNPGDQSQPLQNEMVAQSIQMGSSTPVQDVDAVLSDTADSNASSAASGSGSGISKRAVAVVVAAVAVAVAVFGGS